MPASIPALRDQLGIDVSAVSAPPLRRFAGEGEQCVAELILIDHVVGTANRVDQPHRQFGHRPPTVAEHRHQGDDAGAATQQQHRLLPAPDEVGGERAANLDLIALGNHVMEVGRHLTVFEAIDGQLDLTLVEGR